MSGTEKFAISGNKNPYFGGLSNAQMIPIRQKQIRSVQQDLAGGVLSVEKTQKILQHEMAQKLRERFQQEGISLEGLDPNAFTPERVAGRILGFVKGAYDGVNDSAEKQKILSQAREGIKKGFQEARDILDSIGVLNGKVKEDADKTYRLIQDGLDQLAKPKQATADNAMVNAISSAEAMQARQTKVEIFTREGDKVSIDLSYAERASYSQLSNAEQQTSVSASYSQQLNLHYSVEGDLNADERAAVDDLVKQLNGVAKDFYNGQVDQAFDKASKLGLDNELSKMSFSMQHDMAYNAVGTYQAVQQQSQSPDGQLTKDEKNQIEQFANKMDEVMSLPVFDFIEPRKAITALLDGMLSINRVIPDKEKLKAEQQNVGSLVERLTDLSEKDEKNQQKSEKTDSD